MRYSLKDKVTEPGFNFFVKINNPSAGYFLYNSIEKAMEKARILSLATSKIVYIYEPTKNSYGEWVMEKTFKYSYGKSTYYDYRQTELHVKFYLEAGEWLNPNEL